MPYGNQWFWVIGAVAVLVVGIAILSAGGNSDDDAPAHSVQVQRTVATSVQQSVSINVGIVLFRAVLDKDRSVISTQCAKVQNLSDKADAALLTPICTRFQLVGGYAEAEASLRNLLPADRLSTETTKSGALTSARATYESSVSTAIAEETAIH